MCLTWLWRVPLLFFLLFVTFLSKEEEEEWMDGLTEEEIAEVLKQREEDARLTPEQVAELATDTCSAALAHCLPTLLACVRPHLRH